MSNLQTVQEIYGAFGKGDVPAILSKLADNVEWDTDAAGDVPLNKPRRGRDGVGEFFAATQLVDFTNFSPTTFLESGNVVVALIDVAFTVKATGKSMTQLDEVHIWRFDNEGKVASFRHRVDTHAQHLAFKG
jgi:ketosteroid isomerase-like protein